MQSLFSTMNFKSSMIVLYYLFILSPDRHALGRSSANPMPRLDTSTLRFNAVIVDGTDHHAYPFFHRETLSAW